MTKSLVTVEASLQPFSVRKVWLASEATVGHGVRTFDIRDRQTELRESRIFCHICNKRPKREKS